jgi:osmotically-inducible protein OsmY
VSTSTKTSPARRCALEDRVNVPHDRIKVFVRDGRITLEGEIEWQYQKEAVEEAVRHLIGVKGVINQIIVKSWVAPTEIRSQIEAALQHSAELDAKRIIVETEGSKVTCAGGCARGSSARRPSSSLGARRVSPWLRI